MLKIAGMIEYDPHNWLDHLCDVKGSLLREIAPRIGLCVLWSVGVVFFHLYLQPIHIPSTVHSLVGVALGLLLVFRTNASYDRFWEGRKVWGSLLNEARNLGRQSKVFLAQDRELFRRTMVWTIAFSYAMMNRLQERKGLGTSASLLREEEREKVEKANHLPLACSIQITEALNEARRLGLFSDYIFGTLDQNVQLMIDYVGMCERIHKTPLPFAYVVHLRRALVLYCYSLPFVLIDPLGWVTPFAVLLVTYTFFGIEEIGVEIENPFGFDENDLPLEKMCENIKENLLHLLPDGEHPTQLGLTRSPIPLEREFQASSDYQ